MRTWKVVARLALTASVAVALSTSVFAADVEKKFRIGFQVGGYNPASEAVSDAANTLFVVDRETRLVRAGINDPRNDDAALGSLEIRSAFEYGIHAQYALTKTFIVEFSGGYRNHDLGDVEVQAQFFGTEPGFNDPETYNFVFRTIQAGELEQIPIRATGLLRFRPRTNFNPFIGLGVGYTFVGFTPSEELNELSQRLDGSQGRLAQASLTGSLVPVGDTTDLEGAEIRADDYFSWHAAAGAEYGIKEKWSIFADVRYTFASRDLELNFNGARDVGVAVPNIVVLEGDPIANQVFGPIQIAQGGLLDGGSYAPRRDPVTGELEDPNAPDDPSQYADYCGGTDRDTLCEFDTTLLDGEPDPGSYYVKGGRLKHGGFSFTLGFRYTF